MTWQWRPFGLARSVWHAVSPHRNHPGQEHRWEAACGGGAAQDTELDDGGRQCCLACRRRLLARQEAAQP